MTILLGAGALISGLLIVVEIAQLAFPAFTEGQELEDNPGGLASLFLYLALTFLGVAVFLATAIVFLMWLHRCSTNLPAFGHWKSAGYSPAWTVGSFFVPIANLFVPYQATKEIWQKSLPANSDMFSFSSSPPGFFPAWWGCWLVSNFATNIHFRMTGTQELRDAGIIVGIVSEVLSIAAAIFAIQVIREIGHRQEEAIREMGQVEQFPAPPPPPVFGGPLQEPAKF